MSKMKRLPDAELEVMKVLWQLEQPASRGEIGQMLEPEQSWAPTTILSMLSRLEHKGFVTCEKEGRGNLYQAAVSRREYQANESKTVLDKLFNGSPKAFMASLVQGNALTESDLEELGHFLEEVQNRRE